MTYTSGYQAQNTGASAYSPFNRSGPAPDAYSGYPSAVPTNTYGAAQTQPGQQAMGSDVFLPPASSDDIDTLSGSIDSKIAKIRQAFSQGAPSTAPAQGPQAPAAPPIPEADIQWALQLEQKVKTQSYQPTPQETAKYEDIARKLSAAQQQPQAPAQAPAQGPQAPAAPPIPEADIQWALQLEQKVKTQSYQPTPQETAKYEDIARKLSAAQQQPQAPAQAPAQGPQAPAAPPIPEADIQWALQLEQKVKTQNYQPTPQETAKYEDIARKLSAAQQQPQAPAQAPQAPAGQRNWADWSKPYAVPAAPNMPLPIAGPGGQPVMNVPTSLRGAPQTPPAAMLNQPPGMPQQPAQAPGQPARLPANVSQQEVQWALQLEQRVNNEKYQPNPQEMQQYQNIAQRIAAGQQAPQAPAQMPQAPAQMPQAPVQMPQAPATQPQFQVQPQQAQPQQALPSGLSQQEIQWALQLEQMVKLQNYQPNAQEMQQYQNIAQRLAAGQQAPQAPAQQAPVQMPQAPVQMPQAPAMQPQPQFQAQPQQAQPQQALPNGLSQQEIQWALQLEQRVKTQNYQPTAQEAANYQSIAQRLNSPSQQAPQQFQQAPAQFQQTPGLPQYQAPQPVPTQLAPPTQPVQIVPQSYPVVQPQTPQFLVPPQVQAPQNYQQAPPQQFAPQGQPRPIPPGMPQYLPAPGQGPQGPAKPGFVDKLKTAWGTLWS